MDKIGEKPEMRVLPNSADDNPLKKFFHENQGLRIHKWHHYFDIYHNHFQRYRGTPVKLLEIGVDRGGSLQMWKDYFGPDAQIFGVDILERCKRFEDDQVKIFIGDQANRRFLVNLIRQIGSVDIIIDDGGHLMNQQILTFDVLYQMVKEDGVFLMEDLHTSYWHEYGGGIRHPGTFIEKAKGFIDSLNGWHTRSPEFGPDSLTYTMTGLHFYDSVMVIEKCPNRNRPGHSFTGYDPFAAPQSE